MKKDRYTQLLLENIKESNNTNTSESLMFILINSLLKEDIDLLEPMQTAILYCIRNIKTDLVVDNNNLALGFAYVLSDTILNKKYNSLQNFLPTLAKWMKGSMFGDKLTKLINERENNNEAN